MGETAPTPRAAGSGGGFFSGINEIVFGKKELEVPEEVATDRAKYIADVENVLTTKEGMMPGNTYQQDLKHRFKELMRKNPEYRTLAGPELLEVLIKMHPDENPFRGDRYDRLQMRIQEQVKEVQIEKVTRKHVANAFAVRTGAAPALPPRAASLLKGGGGGAEHRRSVSRDASTAKGSQGMRGVEGRNRAQTLAEPPASGGRRQRSIKFADDPGDNGASSSREGGYSRSYSEGDFDEGDDTVGDLPSSGTPEQENLFTRMFSNKNMDGKGEKGQK